MKRALMVLCLGLGPWAQADHAPYRVQKGDTAWSLARSHGLSVQELLRLNGLSNADLKVGQLLEFTAHIALATPVEAAATPAPVAAAAPVTQRGMAVYYTGQKDPQTTMTAAHLTLPFGTMVKVTHQRSGKSVIVKINDRGPFNRPERIVDLSLEAARELGIVSEGVAPVTLEVLGSPGLALGKP